TVFSPLLHTKRSVVGAFRMRVPPPGSTGQDAPERSPLERVACVSHRDPLGNAVLVLQTKKLFAREVAPLARAQVVAGDSRERHTRQAHDREPGGVTHAADLLVAPLPDGELEPGLL